MDLPATQEDGEPPEPTLQMGGNQPEPGSHPPPADFKTFRPLRNVNPNDFQVRGAHRLGVPGADSPSPGASPGGARALLAPGSAVLRPGVGGFPANSEGDKAEQPRHSSSQPANWSTGTHLKEGETEAQRGPATNPRSHSTAQRNPGGDPLASRRVAPAPVPASVPRGILTAGLAHELSHLLGRGVGSAHGARDRGSRGRVPRRPRAGVGYVAAGSASGPTRVRRWGRV